MHVVKKINQYWKNYNEKQQSPDHPNPSTPMRQPLFESFLPEDISISLKNMHVPMFHDLSILDIIYWFPVVVDEDLPLLPHLPFALPPSTVKSPFSANLITSVNTVMIMEMFTALPSGILRQNFFFYTVFYFPAFLSFLQYLSLKYPELFSKALSYYFSTKPSFSQSLIFEALPPGCSLGLFPSSHPGASSQQWLDPLFPGSHVNLFLGSQLRSTS